MNLEIVKYSLILGLMNAISAFAIDMYLPAMPTMASDLGAPISSAQLTLTVYFLAFGVAQLFWGPLSDMFGRKLPIYLGLGLFFCRIHWLRLRTRHRNSNRTALHSRGCRRWPNVDPARHYSRPLHRAKSHSHDVHINACVFRLANARAVARLIRDGTIWLARRILCHRSLHNPITRNGQHFVARNA